MHCRFCKTELHHIFINLQNSPASNSFLTDEQLKEPEVFYPLKVYTCHNCFLVQVDEYKSHADIFSDVYAYFSSFSSSWLAHAKAYQEKVTLRFGLNSNSRVVEIASNDGYLLQYFKEQGIPVLGIEPTANTAEVAAGKGIETVVDFFGVRLANELLAKNITADLLVGNNVLAHVPDIIDFVTALKIILKPEGVITMEFPHLMQLVDNNQFDTIYHEHFSYFSFSQVHKLFESVGLALFDVEELTTHGGSLRIYAKHRDDNSRKISPSVHNLLAVETNKGMGDILYYQDFEKKALAVKLDFTGFLIEQKKINKKVVAYGAAAKGNTLLNYCGIKKDLIDFVVDASPYKQNKFLPASHIPVVHEFRIKEEKPDFIIILPWNLREEITNQLSYAREWGAKFIIPIPRLEII